MIISNEKHDERRSETGAFFMRSTYHFFQLWYYCGTGLFLGMQKASKTQCFQGFLLAEKQGFEL